MTGTEQQRLNALNKLDRRVSSLINQLELGVLDYVLYPGGYLFGWKGTLLLILPGLHLWDLNIAYLYCLSCGLGQIISRMSKQALKRARPDFEKSPPRRVAGYGKISADSSDGYSFPSGDSMNGMSVAMAFHHAGYPPYFFFIVLYVAFGRIYFNYHWIGDCLGGALLAYTSSMVMTSYKPFGEYHWYHSLIGTLIFVAAMKLTSTSKRDKSKDGERDLAEEGPAFLR